jgi:hypothetical protein
VAAATALRPALLLQLLWLLLRLSLQQPQYAGGMWCMQTLPARRRGHLLLLDQMWSSQDQACVMWSSQDQACVMWSSQDQACVPYSRFQWQVRSRPFPLVHLQSLPPLLKAVVRGSSSLHYLLLLLPPLPLLPVITVRPVDPLRLPCPGLPSPRPPLWHRPVLT